MYYIAIAEQAACFLEIEQNSWWNINNSHAGKYTKNLNDNLLKCNICICCKRMLIVKHEIEYNNIELYSY